MCSHILFPADSSDCVSTALDHVIGRARTYGATLVAPYVTDVHKVGYTAPTLSLERARGAFLESGK